MTYEFDAVVGLPTDGMVTVMVPLTGCDRRPTDIAIETSLLVALDAVWLRVTPVIDGLPAVELIVYPEQPNSPRDELGKDVPFGAMKVIMPLLLLGKGVLGTKEIEYCELAPALVLPRAGVAGLTKVPVTAPAGDPPATTTKTGVTSATTPTTAEANRPGRRSGPLRPRHLFILSLPSRICPSTEHRQLIRPRRRFTSVVEG
jgi:hypothetical protein